MTLSDKIYLKLPILLVSLPLLLIVFIPRPPIGGAQFVVFPILTFFSAIIILNPLKIEKKFINLRTSGGVLFSLLFLSLLVSISQFVNFSTIRLSGTITIFRPILLLLIFLLGLYISKGMTNKNIKRGLYFAAIIIIVGQFIISITQILSIPVFDLIYSDEKARGFGRIFRVTGSLINPNIFGFIVIQASIIVLLFGEDKKKFIWLGFASLLILASGSRSQLLIFPFALFLAVALAKSSINFKFLMKSFVVVIVGLSIFLTTIYIFSDTFRYMAQLFILFEGTDLTAISSLSLRYEMWKDGWDFFLSQEPFYKWWIGLGSRDEIRVADNDFFYTIWHYGLFGLTAHLILYGVLFSSILKCYDKKLKALSLSALILLFILGFQSETLGAWLQPLTVIYYAGLSIGVSKSKQQICAIPKEVIL